VSDQQIRLILDITAVLAYARGSDHVGETIIQVRENGDAFTAGVLTLAAARSAARPTSRASLTHSRRIRHGNQRPWTPANGGHLPQRSIRSADN